MDSATTPQTTGQIGSFRCSPVKGKKTIMEYQRVRVVNVLIVGQILTGKTTFIETLKNPAYTPRFEIENHTKETSLHHLGFVDNDELISLTMIDTPGFNDTLNEGDMIENLGLDLTKKRVDSLNMVLIAIPVGRRIAAHQMDTILAVCGFLGQEMRDIAYILGTHSEGLSDEEKREWITQLKKTNLSSVVKYVKGKFVWGGMMGCETSEGTRRELALQEIKRNQENFLKRALSGPDVQLSGEIMSAILNKFLFYESTAKASLVLQTLLPEMEALANNLRIKRERLADFSGNKVADQLCETYKDVNSANIRDQVREWSNCQDKVESYLETGQTLLRAADYVQVQHNRLTEGDKEILQFLNSTAWAADGEM